MMPNESPWEYHYWLLFLLLLLSKPNIIGSSSCDDEEICGHKKNMFLPKKHTRTLLSVFVHISTAQLYVSRWSPADSIIWNKKKIRMKKKHMFQTHPVYLIAFFFVSVYAKKKLKPKEITCSEWRKSVNKNNNNNNNDEYKEPYNNNNKKTNNVNETRIKNNTETHNDPPKKRITVCASKTHSSVKNRLWCVTISTHHPISINIVTNYQFLCSKT